jgi:predicted NUDIX family NTP pyrophosphohydrolase
MPKEPVITCGIYLYSIIGKKILSCHATNSSWKVWSIPKGLPDDREEYFVAATRELKEETGIEIAKLNIIMKEVLPPVKYKKQNKILYSFFLATDSPVMDLTLTCTSMVKENIPEIDKWAWIDLNEIRVKLHESQQENYEIIKSLVKDLKY